MMDETVYPVIQSEIPARLRLVSPVSAPFVSLEEAKAQLRVTSAHEDAYIGTLVVAAIALVEKICGQSFRQSRFEFTMDRFPNRYRYGTDHVVLHGPVVEIESITYRGADGIVRVMDSADYFVETGVVPARLVPEELWPDVVAGPGSVRVVYVAGCRENDDNAAAAPDIENGDHVPDAIKHAVKLIVSHWFFNRIAVVTGMTATELPWGADALCTPYKVLAGI